VVNDDPTQLDVLCGLAAKAGLKPLPFTGVEAALAAMDPEAPPGLVVTDLYMPGIDGWRFCRLLRSPEYAAFNEVPILVVSATFAGDHPERIAADIGADAFLPSPVDGKEFTAQVLALLAGKEARRLPRVLIVEDSKTLAGLLKNAFAAHGYRADTALSVAEAKAAFAKAAYDVAVLDYHLPDGTGDALLDAFRTGRPDCVCLMMTGDPNPALALSWMKRGAAAYLHKPFAPEFLVELCARARRERALLRAEDLLEARTRELRESEEKRRALVTASPDGIVIAGTDMVIRYVSQKAIAMAGFREAEEICGRSLMEFVDAGDQGKAVYLTGERLKGHYSGTSEYRMIRGDGTRVFVEINGEVLRNADGVPEQMFFTLRDITKRKRAEEALKTSEERLRLANKATNDVVWDWDVVHDTQQWNEAGTAVFGWTEIVERPVNAHWWVERVHPDDRQRVHDSFFAVVDNPDLSVWHDEYRFIKADGAYADVMDRGYVLRDENGKAIRMIGAMLDITERQRAEEKLRTSEAILSASQRIGHIGSWVLELSSGQLTWSDEVYRIFGIEPQAFGATYEAFLDRVHPDDRSAVDAAYAASLRERRDAYEIEHRIVRRDTGEVRHVHERGHHEYDAAGAILRSVGMVQDITERKRAEGALREKLAELERMNRLMVGRENRMIELKAEVNELCRQANLPERYAAPRQLAAELQPDKP
jgi:PAS domain S-box-containing protein